MERECRMWRGGEKKHGLVHGKTDTGNILRKTPKASPAAADFLFESDPEPAAEKLTSYGGAPLLIRTLRSLEVPQSVARHIQIKQRQRGYDEATFVESFVLLNGVGGDCLDDFEQLRADGGLAETLASVADVGSCDSVAGSGAKLPVRVSQRGKHRDGQTTEKSGRDRLHSGRE